MMKVEGFSEKNIKERLLEESREPSPFFSSEAAEKFFAEKFEDGQPLGGGLNSSGQIWFSHFADHKTARDMLARTVTRKAEKYLRLLENEDNAEGTNGKKRKLAVDRNLPPLTEDIYRLCWAISFHNEKLPEYENIQLRDLPQ